MTTWENDILSEVFEYADDGEIVGRVKPIGGSWGAFYKGEMIAMRPDQHSAMKAVAEMHAERRTWS